MVPVRLCQTAKWGRWGPRLRPEQLAQVARFAGVVGYRYSAETVRIYSAVVRRWFQFGGVPGHIDRPMLLAYLRARTHAVSDAAVNIDIKGLRLFYRVQAELGYASAVELSKIPQQRRQHAGMPRVLDEEAVGALLASLPLDDFSGLRDYAMIRLILETGLRPGEVAAMEVVDVLEDRALYVHAVGTRGRDRYVPITEELWGVLHGYMHARTQRGVGRLRAFWVTVYNKPLRGPRAVWDVVSRRMWAGLGRRAGVADLQRAATGRAWRGHYPHELRATCCARWLEKGMDLVSVAALMGHVDVSSTARYLGVDMAAMREAIAHHPRARRVSVDVDVEG